MPNSAVRGVLHLIPFLDFATGWNNGGESPASSTLFSTGFGIGWQQSEALSARIDWGIPLISVQDSTGNSLQKSGVYFSIQYSPF